MRLVKKFFKVVISQIEKNDGWSGDDIRHPTVDNNSPVLSRCIR